MTRLEDVNLSRMDETVRRLAERVSRQLLEQGAKATVVTGSHARGNAGRESDIDLFAIGEGPKEWFAYLDGRFVSVHWWTPEDVRTRMTRPESAFLAVAGWRSALILDDPYGIAAELQAEAREWTWDRISSEADAWVADKLVGWAEYVLKLGRALDSGRELDVCAIRSELALRLTELAAVLKRVVSESENGFWEAVADAGGPEWRDAQERAFAVAGEGPRDSAVAAMQLFELAAAESADLFDERQRSIVEHTLRSSERWRHRPRERVRGLDK